MQQLNHQKNMKKGIIKQAEHGVDEGGAIWQWIYIMLDDGSESSELYKKEKGSNEWTCADFTTEISLSDLFPPKTNLDDILEELYLTGRY